MVFEPWNTLPREVVTAPRLKELKERLDIMGHTVQLLGMVMCFLARFPDSGHTSPSLSSPQLHKGRNAPVLHCRELPDAEGTPPSAWGQPGLRRPHPARAAGAGTETGTGSGAGGAGAARGEAERGVALAAWRPERARPGAASGRARPPPASGRSRCGQWWHGGAGRSGTR